MSDVLNFDFGARKHAPKPKKAKPEPDIPFTLETGGPVYHMRAEIDHEQAGVLSTVFGRAKERGDREAVDEYTQRMLDMLFTEKTVDALLLRMADPDDHFSKDNFYELMERAVQEHSGGRPTTSPRTSSRSRRQTGAKSTGSSSSKGSTSGRSRSTGS